MILKCHCFLPAKKNIYIKNVAHDKNHKNGNLVEWNSTNVLK